MLILSIYSGTGHFNPPSQTKLLAGLLDRQETSPQNSADGQFAIGGHGTVVIPKLAGVGYLPILIYRGRVVRELVEWLIHEKQQKCKSPSSLYSYALSACYLTEFLVYYRTKNLRTPVLREFFETRINGNDELGWKCVLTSTAQKNIDAIETFFDWLSHEHGLVHPNPRIDRPLTWTEWVLEAARRNKTDLLAHLFCSPKNGGTLKKRKYTPCRRAERGLIPRSSSPKSFRFEDFLVLLKHETNPRNKLAWLHLGAAGLRTCELLHEFVTDISCDVRTGECQILLTDPVFGFVHHPESGKARETRKEFLRKNYDMVPRDELRRTSTGYAGWKGMRFQSANTAGVAWLHPYLGQLAWKLHLEYLQQRGCVRTADHPWYFVNLDPSRTPEVKLHEVRRDRRSASTIATDRARTCRARAVGACAGLEVRRSSSALSPVGDLRSRRRRSRSLHTGRLGRGDKSLTFSARGCSAQACARIVEAACR
jgi:hypothetical protein